MADQPGDGFGLGRVEPEARAELERYLGAKVPAGDGRAYLREVGRRWMISAAARVHEPGCKADCALVLEGPQGAGKSSALAALMPDREWFADEISDLGGKDSAAVWFSPSRARERFGLAPSTRRDGLDHLRALGLTDRTTRVISENGAYIDFTRRRNVHTITGL